MGPGNKARGGARERVKVLGPGTRLGVGPGNEAKGGTAKGGAQERG